MQKQINKIDQRLDKHDQRITKVEKFLFVCFGLLVGMSANNLNLLELVTK